MRPLPPKSLLIVLITSVVWCAELSASDVQVRVATFNTSMFRNSEGDLATELEDGDNPQAADARRIAEIIQRVRPDIILLNEFDYDPNGLALERFHANFLGVGQGGQAPIEFPYRFVAESNTGIASCFDLDNNGTVGKTPKGFGYGDDAFGFGQFPGQYAMAFLSKHPILLDEIRTFQKFLWKDMPDARLPDKAITPAPQDWYSMEELEVFRLSSKSHWDLPIDVDGKIVHVLAAHPTPPAPFDGPEDSDGLRNHDEIRLWADYVSPSLGGYLYDDDGKTGGIGDDARFVICGDYNADPDSGESVDRAILQLLDNPAVDASFVPQGASGTTNTATFGLRVDYVLPSAAGLSVVDGGIFWPTPGQDGADLIGASDHRLVWMDLRLSPLISEAVSNLNVVIDDVDVVLTWGSAPGVQYGVESSPDLRDWTPVAGAMIEIVGGTATFRDTSAATTPGRKFYRVTADCPEPG